MLKGLQDVAWSDDEVSPPFQAFALGIMAVVERRDVTREASVELGWMHVFTASDGPFRVNRVLKLRLINLIFLGRSRLPSLRGTSRLVRSQLQAVPMRYAGELAQLPVSVAMLKLAVVRSANSATTSCLVRTLVAPDVDGRTMLKQWCFSPLTGMSGCSGFRELDRG